MKVVGIVGVGYVGLTQAIGMAQLGHKVIAYDVDSEKIEQLKKANSPFFEPGVEEALADLLSKNQISFTQDQKTLSEAEFTFLCLPTPQGEDGSADTTYLETAVKGLAPNLNADTFLIVKSTVPVNAWKTLKELLNNPDIHLVSNPEFLREGSALADFHKPDRIVIGANSDSEALKIKELYGAISTEFVLTDNTSAELIKYAANSFLAIKLSFVNDLAALCENLEANPQEVLYGVGLDKRIGNKFLTPGPGWGGSCFPKDVRALAKIADSENLMMPLLFAAIESNENAQERVVTKILNHFGTIKSLNVGVLGLAFKADTDDTRNSPAVNIAKRLVSLGANVIAHDPEVNKAENLRITKNIEEIFFESQLVLLLTEWSSYKDLDFSALIPRMETKVFYDSRGILNKDWLKSLGVTFIN